MAGVATLYVRNLPADLYDELRRWAEEHDRSVNAEVLDILRNEFERRQATDDGARSLEAYFEKYGDQPVDVDAVAMIREDRDRGHKPEFGY
jgi:plasmid stability protein